MFYFVRRLEDGRLSTAIPQQFRSVAEAKAAAPELLSRLHQRAGDIVLVQVINTVKVTGKVEYGEPK